MIHRRMMRELDGIRQEEMGWDGKGLSVAIKWIIMEKPLSMYECMAQIHMGIIAS